MFSESRTVFWSNTGILVIPCMLDVNLIPLFFFSWFRKSERPPVMGREWVNIYFFNHCCLGRLGWSRRCWLYYGDQSVIQNNSIWVMAVTLSVRIITSLLFPYDCLDHRNTFCDILHTACPRKQPTFATSPLVSPRNNVRETRAEIPYRWRVTLQFLVVVLIGCLARESCFNQSTTQIWVVTRHSVEFFRSVLKLQNKPHVCVAKNARTVKRKVWSKGDNREWDWDSLRAFTNRFWKKKKRKTSYLSSFGQQPSPLSKDRRRSPLYLVRSFLRGGDGCT